MTLKCASVEIYSDVLLHCYYKITLIYFILTPNSIIKPYFRACHLWQARDPDFRVTPVKSTHNVQFGTVLALPKLYLLFTPIYYELNCTCLCNVYWISMTYEKNSNDVVRIISIFVNFFLWYFNCSVTVNLFKMILEIITSFVNT